MIVVFVESPKPTAAPIVNVIKNVKNKEAPFKSPVT
jgi:hypothetical protein